GSGRAARRRRADPPAARPSRRRRAGGRRRGGVESPAARRPEAGTGSCAAMRAPRRGVVGAGDVGGDGGRSGGGGRLARPALCLRARHREPPRLRRGRRPARALRRLRGSPPTGSRPRGAGAAASRRRDGRRPHRAPAICGRGPDMTYPNPSTALASVVVDELARGEVGLVLASPGARSTALVLAAAQHPGIGLHVVIDERSAAFQALGWAKAAGRPAAVITTSGTAVANLVPAVVEADSSGVPLVVVSADRPPEERGVGANQAIDQRDIF